MTERDRLTYHGIVRKLAGVHSVADLDRWSQEAEKMAPGARREELLERIGAARKASSPKTATKKASKSTSKGVEE